MLSKEGDKKAVEHNLQLGRGVWCLGLQFRVPRFGDINDQHSMCCLLMTHLLLHFFHRRRRVSQSRLPLHHDNRRQK